MPDEDPRIDRLTPEEAFALVSDETRFAVLRALQAADDPLSFSELRDRAGVDDPGRFNYHLGELTDQFVAKTDEGYAVTPPGERLVGAVLAGGYTAALDADPVSVDGECLNCGGSLVARFRDQGVTIDCEDCEAMFTNPQVPAGLVADQPVEDAPAVVGRWNRVVAAAVDAGICLNCYGPLDRRLYFTTDDDAPEWVAESDLLGMVYHDCQRCGHAYNAAVQLAVLSHPKVAAYHDDHGIDVRTTPAWEIPWLEVGRGTVESMDPVRIVLPIPLGDETRTFVFDGDLDVLEVRTE
ncbi:winged helix-turn-helix domain-containing protein [Halobacterium bonnevillei]|uniref:Helix-turn-helix domain-containing protein n=1 Tax=Halobacterium bonnevillei TaxID=2692200 RepID=A0A6B0SMK8_9EURY|nr:helix-turn-helix domain-containing protein [Halobacterium bonnevillei]MXR21736.1 helix-turn-helix domain-containing protein [Halobacterium bonnevillei]